MNAALILSGGSGRRFQSEMPKQYHRIGGKMVIEYVLDAVCGARAIDRVVICAQLPCAELMAIQPKYGFTLAMGGARRNDSLQSGLDALALLGCEQLIVLDAVRPLVTGALLDQYIAWLAAGYDAVVTAQPITDSLGCLDLPVVDRARYYLMQSPEGFHFDLLRAHFNAASPLTEVTQQLPQGSKIKLNFDFSHNVKLTYPWELHYIESALNANASAREESGPNR